MIQGASVLAIIPARGGSKGIPRKNIRLLGGKPLLAWTVAAAKKSKYIDRLIVSSDDDEILAVAKTLGCDAPFKRPAEFAADDTPGVVPVLHALSVLPQYDIIVLLQPTSPLRISDDIDSCLELLVSRSVDSSVSVTESAKSPYWMYSLDGDSRMLPVMMLNDRYTRRQDMPKVFLLNGAVYVARSKWLLESKNLVHKDTLACVMPPERSIDVDGELDWICAEAIIAAAEKPSV